MVPSAEVKAVEPKPKKIRHAANKATGAQDTAGPPIIKIFDNGAKGRNQPVQCKLGDLREVQEKNQVARQLRRRGQRGTGRLVRESPPILRRNRSVQATHNPHGRGRVT